jgi:hypothetical protein
MNQKDLFNQAIINEVDKCYLCKEKLTDDERHVTINFKKDDGKFNIEYIVVCTSCVKVNQYKVMMLGEGSLPFPKVSLS